MRSKQRKRDTTRYNLWRKGKIVRTGITNDPDRREQEHRRRYGPNANLIPVGPKVTRETALKWEDEQREKGKPTGP